MFSVYKENPRASFGFIGANCEGENEADTKRYRVYRKIVATQISEEQFIHTRNKEKSACMLINRMELQEYPNLIEEIERTFQELYDFFEWIEGEIFWNSEDFANSNIPVYTPTEFSQIPYWMDEQKSSVLNEAEIPYGKITE